MDEIRDAEGAESWTEALKEMHFYPDLHGTSSLPSLLPTLTPTLSPH